MQLAEETHTILEINANPKRLDLNAETVRKYPNVKLTINTDAHHTNHLEFMKYGVATAQKVLLKDRVINTLSREAFKSFIDVRHIAHPTGRIIGRRPGYEPNIEIDATC